MKIFVVLLFLFAFIFIVAAAFPSQVQMYLGKIIALLSYREKTSFTGHFLIFLHGILTYSCCVDLEELLRVSIVLLYYSIQKEKNTPFLICGTYFWGKFWILLENVHWIVTIISIKTIHEARYCQRDKRNWHSDTCFTVSDSLFVVLMLLVTSMRNSEVSQRFFSSWVFLRYSRCLQRNSWSLLM